MRHLQTIAVASATVASLALWTTWYLVSRRLTPAQRLAKREARRRADLATHGRIIDGILLDAQPSGQSPAILFYTYRVAGVTYETSQDVAPLTPPHVHPDAPIQVRYNPANPGNSIVLAETWNGLW